MNNPPNLTKIPLDYNNTDLFTHKHYGIFFISFESIHGYS
jgi:hypothetical protein